MQAFEKTNNMENVHEIKNEMGLGTNSLNMSRGRMGKKLKFFSNFGSDCEVVSDLGLNHKNDPEEYVSSIWESKNKTLKIKPFKYLSSKNLFFFSKRVEEAIDFDIAYGKWKSRSLKIDGTKLSGIVEDTLFNAITVVNLPERKKEIATALKKMMNVRKFGHHELHDEYKLRLGRTLANKGDVAEFFDKEVTDKHIITEQSYRILDGSNLGVNRVNRFYDSEVRLDLARLALDSGYPANDFAKRTIMSGYIRKCNVRTTARGYLRQYAGRHPITQFRQMWKHMTTTMSTTRFEKWTRKFKYSFDFSRFYRSIWRYFKFKIERYFHRRLGARVHIWMMNVWDIFLSGIDSYWQWYKFEDQKLFALTRKGQRFLLEKRDDAKLYLRAMVLTLTLGGGVKLYIDKITEMVRLYRNNWAFITHSMESLRRCGNFFWFRFFLNYKVAFQGKIAGILRAEKKIFKKGEVTIEDRTTVIAYHRTFPQSKFGSYSLGFWLQYRVPNLIGTFNEMEYIDTMRVLLSMYTVPWLSERLTEIIHAILKEKEVKDQLRFNQYNRRAKGRAIISKELNTAKRLLKVKKKAPRRKKL